MSNSDRKSFLRATVLDQDFLDNCHDNLSTNLEMICDVYLPETTLRLSDRDKYVGSTFYRARIQFPEIKRTIGDFLAPNLEFSDLTIDIANVDGFLNEYLPGGQFYRSWIGSRVVVQMGLRDVESTYRPIFEGFITAEGGFSRNIDSVTITARDKFDRSNKSFPTTTFSNVTYPNIEDNLIGQTVPVIYGHWINNIDERIGASVPAYVVNGADGNVNGENEDVGGNPIHTTPIQCVISENVNKTLDITNIYYRKGDLVAKIDPADIQNVSNNNYFEILQDTGNTIIDPEESTNLTYSKGDEIFVLVRGKPIGLDENIVEIARDILKTYGDYVDADFDASWVTFRDKTTPAQSSVFTFRARAWVQDPKNAVEYALSLLEQVRLEFFVNADLKLAIRSLHLEDFVANPDFTVRNWDVVLGAFTPKIDERNNFNRAKGDYNFLPSQGENFYSSGYFINQNAINDTQTTISKTIVFPNLYDLSVVEYQIQEILRLTSAYLEIIECENTWRSLLLDIGDFVKMDVDIQGTRFDNVPCVVRDIGYDPQGFKIILRLWSFQMVPFNGYTPGFAGTNGGITASITKE